MITQKIYLYFPECQTDTPVVYHLVKEFDLMVNILRAKINANEEGYLVLNLTGEQDQINKAIEYVRELNVEIRTKEKGLYWDQTKCTGCSNCLTHCPTQALYMKDRTTMEIAFDPEKCIECLSCIDNCPYGACTSLF